MIPSSKSRVALAAILSAALLAGCFGKSAQEDLDAAKASRDKGERSTAIIQTKSALQKNPNMVEARVLLARVLYETGDMQAAALELDKATSLGGQEDAVVALQARVMLARGEGAKAIEQLGGKTLKDKAEQVDLLTTLAMAYGAEHKVDQAVQSVDEALKLDPANRRTQLVRIRIVRVQAGLDTAMKEIDAYLERQPRDSEAWQIKGEFAAAAGKTDDAISSYRQSVTAAKRNLASQSALIRLLLDKKDLVAAAAQIKEMRTVSPKGVETEFLAAGLALARNEIGEANERIQRVLKVAGGDPRVMQLAATIDLRRGALQEADALLGKVVLAQPENTTARLMQSRLQLQLGDSNKAESILQPLLDVPNPSADTLALASEIQMSEGDVKSADEYLQKVAQLKPNDVRVQVALAMSAVRTGKSERGIADLRAIAAKDRAVYAEMGLVNIFIDKHDYAQALAVTDGMEKKFPGRAGVAALRGRIFALKGDQDKAQQEYDRALKIDPLYYPAVTAAVALDSAAGKVAQAEARLQPVLKANPRHVQAQMTAIALRQRAGAKPEDTVQALRALISKMPSEMEPRQALINFQIERKDFRQALAAAQEAVAALPEAPELWTGLGRAQALLGSDDQAMTALNKVIGLRPRQPDAYMPLAQLYAAKKDSAAAARVLDRALNVKPDYLPAQIARMQMANATGDKATAMKMAKQVQTQQPQNPIGLVMAGDTETVGGSWSAAADDYRAALAKGADTEVAIKLDIALASAKRVAESAKFEADWLAAHPKDEMFLGHLGSQAIVANDFPKAEAQFNALLKIKPDNASALNNLAWVLGMQKKPGAIDAAEKANALMPNQPSFMDTLADLYAQSGQVAKAIELQKKVVALTPENPAVRLSLARYYLAAGQKDAAREELKRLAALGDKLPQQAEVQKLLGTV